MKAPSLAPDQHRAVDLDCVLASIEDLPTIPETLIDILKVLDDPASGAAQLAMTVRRDAPLMAKILKLANSPYYSARGDIADINRCVTVLGYRTVRQVAIGVSVATVLVKAVSTAEGQLDYREIWQHSVVTAAVARHLAVLSGYPEPEAIFTAGLLHDIGKFILELYAPQEYARVVRERRPGGHGSLVAAEREHFGFDHAAAGAAFARLWRFPDILTLGCARHHDEPQVRADSDPLWHATSLVALADRLANELAPSQSDLGFDPRRGDLRSLHLAAKLTLEAVAADKAAIRLAIDKALVYLSLT